MSLKAKGLLSYMLSLPDDWDYSLKELTTGCRDGLDSVRTAVLELEEHGYVRRQKVRNAKSTGGGSGVEGDRVCAVKL